MIGITEENLVQFNSDGFFLAKGLLVPEIDLGPFKAEYSDVLDKAVLDIQNRGMIKKKYIELPFEKRISQVLEDSDGELNKYLDITPPQKDIDSKTPMHFWPTVFNLIRNSKLLNVVEQFIGSEIYSNPTQHARIKPPAHYLADTTRVLSEIDTTVWHQDAGTGTSDADHTNTLTVWISVTAASIENGCLMVAPKSHRKGLVLHCNYKRANYSRQSIPERLIGEVRKSIETKPGDVIFLSKHTMHSSSPNLSENIRRSLDLRYNPVGQPTGRAWFPGFVARSKSNPGSEMNDSSAWKISWERARKKLTRTPPSSFQRWSENDPNCA